MSDEEKLELDHEYGYTRTPNIILESLALTDINATQYRLCLYLVRMTYGWNRSEAPIALSEFASATHAAKEYVSRLMAGLLRKNIIARSESRWPGEGMVYQFNNPAEWDYGSVWQEVVHNQQKGLYRFHRRRRFRRRSALMHPRLNPIRDPQINGEVLSDQTTAVGSQLHDRTTRQHSQSSHLLDYEPCLKTNLKTVKDRKTLRHDYDVRHKCLNRKGSYVDMKVKSYVDMTPELYNHTTMNPKQASSTAEFKSLLNTGLKKVKENVLYFQPKDSENTTANSYDGEQVHRNNQDLSDRDKLLINQERISSDHKSPKDKQKDPLYQVYLMWRDSIFGQKDIQFQDWLEMKQTRSRDGP